MLQSRRFSSWKPEVAIEMKRLVKLEWEMNYKNLNFCSLESQTILNMKEQFPYKWTVLQ